MDHSYEEIRAVAIDIVSGKETVSYTPNQFQHLLIGVGEVLQRRESPSQTPHRGSAHNTLSRGDSELVQEVFWDLFRQNIITLGADASNGQYPFFRVSRLGKKVLENQNPYFFHDVSSYEALIKSNVPTIDNVTLLYLLEAAQSFRSGCVLASTVMLGVASEHSFLLMFEAAEQSSKYGAHFSKASNQFFIHKKFLEFRATLSKHVETELPFDVKDSMDIYLDSILMMIRTFRNESGHPSGKIIEREQAFVLLQMFVPYCKKLYQLKAFFESE